jgi:hypothetical protein
MEEEGKGKIPMSEEYLRRPSPTLQKPLCPRKGTLFVVALWIFGVVYSSWSTMISFP